MQELINIIQKAHQLLQQVRADALNPQMLHTTEESLNEINIREILKEAANSLPQKPVEEDKTDEFIKESNRFSDQLNKELAPLNKELERVKQLRETLNLEALDGIIAAAQKIIRPVYNLSSSI